MMYQNKFVVAIKAGGQILRELGETVTIPFGSEYAVLVKNIHTVRAKFRISIDGEDTGNGQWFVVGPNQSTEIERFCKDGDFSRGRRFKFIERTQAVEDHRGIKADDGLIRVEYQIEKPPITFNWQPLYAWQPYYGPWLGSIQANQIGNAQNFNFEQRARGLTESSVSSNMSANGFAFANLQQAQPNDTGITVAGTESRQQFTIVSDFLTGPSEAIVIHLRGRVHSRPVKVAYTVRRRVTCSSCGKLSKSYAEFCSRCGTSLVS